MQYSSNAYMLWKSCYREYQSLCAQLKVGPGGVRCASQQIYFRLKNVIYQLQLASQSLNELDMAALDRDHIAYATAVNSAKKVFGALRVTNEDEEDYYDGKKSNPKTNDKEYIFSDALIGFLGKGKHKKRVEDKDRPKVGYRYSERAFSGTDVEIYVLSQLTDEMAVDAFKDQVAAQRLAMTNPIMGSLAGNAVADTLLGVADTPEGLNNITKKAPALVKPLIQAMAVEYSSFRAKPQARPLGFVNPSGFGKATRSIAGTITSALMHNDVFHTILDNIYSAGIAGNEAAFYCLDLLPPIDIVLTFANEYGVSCFRMIHGLEFITEDASISINTPVVMSTLQFVAKDATPVVPLSDMALDGESKQQTIVRAIDHDFFKRIVALSSQETTYADLFTKDYAYIFNSLYWRY